MRSIFFTVFCLFAGALGAQMVVDVSKTNGIPQNAFYSVGGSPFVNVKFVNLVSGTPYFKEEWLKGSGTAATGAVYKAGVIKLDLTDNQIHFLDPQGVEMIATSPLKELTLSDTIMNTSWRFVHSSYIPSFSQARQGWYQQVVQGSTSLYHHYLKLISEKTPYGTATTEQYITTKDEFYLLHNGTLQQVKKPKDIITILADKQAALEDVLKLNKNNSTEQQMKALVEAYNKQ